MIVGAFVRLVHVHSLVLGLSVLCSLFCFMLDVVILVRGFLSAVCSVLCLVEYVVFVGDSVVPIVCFLIFLYILLSNLFQ